MQGNLPSVQQALELHPVLSQPDTNLRQLLDSVASVVFLEPRIE